MLRLLTFGGLSVEPNGSPVAPRLRPPRLALLSVLAVAGDRGVSRERLVALFWPESDEEHGRHSLRQSLYALKNEAGRDLLLAGASLALNPQLIASDLEAFRSAVERGDHRQAAELYRGPFLDGFYLSGSPEFERWVEHERTRLAESARAALLELAGRATAAGSHDESVRWWRQLTLLEPLSARFALGLARALVASGDRPRALAAIRAHETLVRRELEVEPDPELRALEQHIRSRLTPDPARAGAGETQTPGSAASPASGAVAIPKAHRAKPWIRRVRLVLTIAAIILVAVVVRQVLSRPAVSAQSALARPSTRSALAARFYEEGLRAYRIRDNETARRLMDAALREDSTFAMAAYIAALAVDEPSSQSRERAIRLAAAAPERERLLILADLLTGNMEPRGLAIAEEAAARYPDEPGILLALGTARMHSGDLAGAVVSLEQVLNQSPGLEGSHRESCLSCDALGLQTEVYWWWDSLPAVERNARRMLQAHPDNSWAWATLAKVGARTGDTSLAFSSLRRYLTTAPAPIPKDEELVTLLTLEQYEMVEREVQPMLASPRRDVSGVGRWMFFIALRNQGRLQDAELLLKTGRIGTSTPVPAVAFSMDQNEALIALEGGNPQRAAAFFDVIRHMPHHAGAGQYARWRAWNTLLMGTALAAAGDTAAVRLVADTVQYWGERTLFVRDRTGHHFLRGLLLAAQGKDEEAVSEYRAAMFSWSFGYTRVNYELARALLRLGRPAEAVSALQPALRGSIDASNLYITRTELHELLAEAFERVGQPDSARAHYGAVVRAWARADARFIPRREAAQRRIAQLAG